MAVDFSRRVNTDLSTTPFQYIVFGKDGGLLEVELNEAQMLAYERQKNTLKLLGDLYSNPSMFKYDSEKGVFSIEPGILSVNGYLINITDTVSIPNVTDGSNVYVTVTTETVDKDSTIKKFGISSEENIENTIKDGRIGIETSRRESISVTIGTTSEDNSVLLGDISGTEFIISSEFRNIPKGFTEFDNALDEINSNLSSHTSNTSNPHSVTKAQVGLGNVENKSSVTIRGEITKSNVTTALGYTPLNQSLKGSASGLAELDSNGKVPSSQLPSYVDDVIEGYLSGGKFYKESAHTTEITGESGKIYIDLHTGKTYRWSGSTFGVISETLALGETSSTAYRGDRGKIAYDHSQTAHAPSNAQANVIETIKVNGTAITPSSKAVNITVPTNNNQLTNGAGYITSSEASANALINSLDEGLDTPSDNDYYISQYAGGGTTHRTYYRKPVSALWNYIKSKLATVATSGSYNDLSNKPTIPTVGNGTVTIKQSGASKGTFTMNQSGNKTIELDNTWRGIQDNLTSTSTTDSLSAKQGKILNEKFGTTLTSTLSAGSTSLVFSNSVITTSSTIDLYTDKYGVNPTNVVVETGKMTLTFDAQTKDISVKAVIK